MMSSEHQRISLPKKILNCQEIKKCMHDILHENLHDKQYDSGQRNSLAKNLSNTIKDSLKRLGYERYKFIIQILISQEQSDDSLQMTCRSYWDSETDKFAQSIYMNQFFICIATAFAVFYY